MPITITLSKPKDFQKTLLLLKDDAQKYNVSFNGKEHNGFASGYGFEASYIVLADKISITVHKKPLIVSASTVVKEITNYVRGLAV